MVLSVLLLTNFFVTVMVPITGIHVHKLASVIFLLLCIVHTIKYRKNLGKKKIWALTVVVLSFASGLMGMILEQYPMILQLHKAISMVTVFILAIHIFVYHRRLGFCEKGRSK